MNKNANPQTDLQVAQDIIRTSGNRLHCEVASYFRKRQWTARISQYYVDATTDKARELDLVVEKVFEFPGGDEQTWVHLHVRLCIECKYVTKPVVFWFDTRDESAIAGWIDSQARPFSTNNTYKSQLHYVNSGRDVAKLYASGKESEESEPIFRALNQCLHGFVNTSGRSIVDPSIKKRRQRLKEFTLSYPVIVFSTLDHFYRTDLAGSGEPRQLDSNFLLEINYAYPNVNGISVPRYFLVDMVSLPTLDDLLRAIDNEVEAAKVLA